MRYKIVAADEAGFERLLALLAEMGIVPHASSPKRRALGAELDDASHARIRDAGYAPEPEQQMEPESA